MDTVILASGSPRRRDLLTRVRIPFKVISPSIPEEQADGLPVAEMVAALAKRKVEAVLDAYRSESPRWVIGADTVVEVGGKVLGKPQDPEAASAMLQALSGQVHRVYTGLALCVEKTLPIEIETVRTEVKFREMAVDEIRFYIETGEWTGAAGAYRIQERGSFFVEWIKGSYSNVVGLPLETFYGMLKRNSFRF